MDYENLLALIKRRRSIRRYKPEPVPMETVMKVLEAARWAPSGDNSQPWEFVVVRDNAKVSQVLGILIEGSKQTRQLCPRFSFVHPERLKDVSTFIIVCADPRFKAAYPQSQENDVLAMMYRENSGRILIENVAIAVAHMHLAAFSLGLGTVWLTGVGESITEQQMKKALNIPKELQLICCLPLGYPAKLPQSSVASGTRRPRPLETMVHLDGFDESKWRSDEDVAKLTQVDRHVWANFYKTGRID